MAAEIITPTDELSGLPLPIMPSRAFLPLNNPDVADWHHHWHPRLDPGLRTAAGMALRNCRIQLVERQFHNDSPKRYHRFFAGPTIPESEDEVFKIVVLATAGYIPRDAIDLRTGEPKIVRLNSTKYKMLKVALKITNVNEPGISHTSKLAYRNVRYGYEPIRDFLAEYCITQHVDMKNSFVDEFLHTQNNDRRQYLGQLFLAKRAEAAAEKVEEKFRLARKEKLINPNMPHPHELIKHKLGRPETRRELFPRLAAQLAINHGTTDLILRGDRAII